MLTSLDYYYQVEGEQFSFYRIPKVLLTDLLFASLTFGAKILYGLMLDRMSLSRQSGWLDSQGRIYIYFTLENVQKLMGCGRTKAAKLLRELDGIGLIRRVHQGQGRPDRIYVMNFTKVLHEVPENPVAQSDEIQTAENHTSAAETAEKCTSGGSEVVPQACQIPTSNKTERSKTEISETESPHPIPLQGDEEEKIKAELRELWGYQALLDNYTADELEGIISLGADVLMTRGPTISIGGEKIPTQQAQKRFWSLDFTHIDYVLEQLAASKTLVGNVRGFLRSCLYYAPTTIDAYYAMRVAQDERAGKWADAA